MSFPPDELARAAGKIHDAIRDQEAKLHELNLFSEENKELYTLIEDLPQNVSYNIMVPFGKAAFFPGKLVHTNEMMVFLGEGYYAERSAKQTLEILSRRSKFLEKNMESIKAQIDDLRMESSFAQEAAEDLVDIVEEYVEPTEQENQVFEAEATEGRDDEEDDRIFARLEELIEVEEADASDANRAGDEFVQVTESELEAQEVATSETRVQVDSASSPHAPAIKSPADLVHFEDWKKRTWKNTKLEEDKAERRVSFDLPPEPRSSLEQETKPSTTLRPPAPAPPESSSNVAATTSRNPMLEQRQNKAFTGVVVERTAPLTSKDDTRAKPASRFKQRLR